MLKIIGWEDYMKYTLMNKETPVLDIEIDEISNTISNILDIYNIEYLPLGVTVRNGIPDRASLVNWWRTRSIPASRSGLQNVLFDLGIPDQYYLLTKSYGLSLTDQYWINPLASPLEWEKINFFDNSFSEDVGNAFWGNIDYSKKIDLLSPDNTSDGWLKKKWKIINGDRYLIKSGSPAYYQEPLNEVIATNIYRRLNAFDYVEYSTFTEKSQPYSLCKNFITTDTEFVSAYQVFISHKQPNHISPYDHFVNCCIDLGIPNIKDYLDFTLTCDYIISNTDRHLNNFGLIRNVNTLEITQIAPIFDNGTSLWHNLLTSHIDLTASVLSRPFRRYHNEQLKLVNSFDKFNFDKLRGLDEEVNEIMKKYPTIDDERISLLCKGINQNIKDVKVMIDTMYQNKSILVENATVIMDTTLLSSTETSIVNKIKAAGYKPTQNLIINIKALNNLLGKEPSIQELMDLYKRKYKLIPEEKLLISAIGKELINQKE